MERNSITWDAPEYVHFERSSDWYWSLGIIAAAMTVLAILFGNFLFGIFIVLAAVTVGMYAYREPKFTHIELQPKGIIVDRLLYTYSNLESFWIDEHHHGPRIILKSKKVFSTHIIIPISHIPVDDVREYLLQYLPEVEHQESLGHKLFDYLGF